MIITITIIIIITIIGKLQKFADGKEDLIEHSN
jgi:hypothetical protein